MTRNSGKLVLLMTSICIMTACHRQAASPDIPAPPDAEQRRHVVAAPAGERDDPYYWLRDDSRREPDMLALLEAENEYTRAMLADQAPLIDELAGEMRARIPGEQVEAPYFDDGFWYYTRYEKGGEYPIHARRKGSMEAAEEVLIDGNRMGRDEDYFRIGGWDVSPDGSRLLWLQDVVGRRQFRLMIRDLESGDTDAGESVDTGISGVSSASWAADGKSIFYVENHPETLRSFRVRRHVPGGVNGDEVLYEEPDTAFYTSVGRTRSDRYNYIYLRSTTASEMRVIDSREPGARFEIFFPREPNHEYTADHAGARWVIRTNWQAPNYRIMRTDEDSHADRSTWIDVVAHREDVFIHEFDAFGEFLAIAERADGLRQLRIVDYAGRSSEVLEFDEPVHVAQLGRNPEAHARLRDLKTDDNPLLLHVNMEAGHGGLSGRFRRLGQTAMEYAFVLDRAGLN